MSGRKPRAKKQRVEREAAFQRPVNSFGLVASKSLPQHLELLVLSYLETHELYELPEVSKDVGKLTAAYFSQVREWSFATLPATVPRVLRSCRQLQSLCIQYAYNDQEPLEDVAGIIRDNAETLRRFECHFCFPMCVIDALGNCASLTAVDGLGHCRTSMFKEYNELVRKSSDGWTQIAQLGLSLKAASAGASQLSPKTASYLLSKDWPLQRLTVEGPIAALLPSLVHHSRLEELTIQRHYHERQISGGREHCAESAGDDKALSEYLPKLVSLRKLVVDRQESKEIDAGTWVLPPNLSTLHLVHHVWDSSVPTVVASHLTALTMPNDARDDQVLPVLKANAGLRELKFGGFFPAQRLADAVLQLSQLERLDCRVTRYMFAGITEQLPRLRSLHAVVDSDIAVSDAPALLSRLPLLERCAMDYFLRRDPVEPIFPSLRRLVTLPALTDLDLNHFERSVLKLRMPNLRSLELWGNKGDVPVTVAQFERLARATPLLQTLRLQMLTAPPALKKALLLWPGLTELCIRHCKAPPQLLLSFVEGGKLSRLRSLHLYEWDEHDPGFLAKLFAELPQLRFFDGEFDADVVNALRALLPPERARVMRLAVFESHKSDPDQEVDF